MIFFFNQFVVKKLDFHSITCITLYETMAWLKLSITCRVSYESHAHGH